jgi:hypothetical protein
MAAGHSLYKFFSGVLLKRGLKHGRFDISQCHRFTDAHAFRIAITEIALKDAPPMPVKTHGAEGTGLETHFASNTPNIINHDPFQGLIPVDGLFGADNEAGGIRTMHAGQGQVEIFKLIILNDANAGQFRIVHSNPLP